MGALDFVWGVEMEMLLTPTAEDYKYSSREKLYEHLASALKSDGIEAYVKKAKEPLSEYEEGWVITSDSSLQEKDGAFGVEFVSPLLTGRNPKAWGKQIDDIWKAIKRVNCEVKRDNSCGTHIHISPQPKKKFGLESKELQALYKSIVVFDQTAITSILPLDRKDNENCKPNTDIQDSTLKSKYGSCLAMRAKNKSPVKVFGSILERRVIRDSLLTKG